jgi:hypothetical protein
MTSPTPTTADDDAPAAPSSSPPTTRATRRAPSPRARRARRLRYLPNVLRLVAFCTFVSLVVAAFTVRAVAGNLREGMLSLGHEMMRYTDRAAMGPARTLSLNGAAVDFATGSTQDTVEHVLGVYERRCASHDGSVAQQIADLAGTSPRAGEFARQHGLSTMRAGDDRQGFVACLDLGDARVAPEEILRRVRSFVASGDVADVGRMRYLYAERANNGRTRFIAFWADGEVNVRRMFPAAGDAPGADVPSVPRGPGLRRLLSAYEVGQNYAMEIYAGRAPRPQLEAFYRDAMPRNGWSPIPMRGGAPDLHGQTMLTYEKGATTVSLVFDSARDGTASVTVLAGM